MSQRRKIAALGTACASTWDIFAHQEQRLRESQRRPSCRPEFPPVEQEGYALVTTSECGANRLATPESSPA